MFRNPLTDAIVVLLILLLFFGPKRLPMLSRSIGESIKEFKGGIGSSDDDQSELGSGKGAASEDREKAQSGADRDS